MYVKDAHRRWQTGLCAEVTTVSAPQLGREANTNYIHKVSQARDSQSCPKDEPAALSRPRDGSAVRGFHVVVPCEQRAAQSITFRNITV